LDTVIEDLNGIFFCEPESRAIAKGVQTALTRSWNSKTIQTYAGRFDEEHFSRRLRSIVMEEASFASARS
jgi:hypothetical protein